MFNDQILMFFIIVQIVSLVGIYFGFWGNRKKSLFETRSIFHFWGDLLCASQKQNRKIYFASDEGELFEIKPLPKEIRKQLSGNDEVWAGLLVGITKVGKI